MSGFVTPDTYVLDRHGALIARNIAPKEVMTVMTDGGTREVPVLGMMREQPSLTDEQARAVAEQARSLEAHMGWPVDIEFAFAENRLHLLQCRPITILR